MNMGRRVMLLMLCGSVILRAEEPQITAQVLPQNDAAMPVFHGFSGEATKLSIAIDAPLGTQLAVKAALVQVAHGIAAPVNQDISVIDALKFADRSHHVIEARIALPEVKRVTGFLVKFRLQSTGSETWQAAGQAMLVAHPTGQFDGFKRFRAALETKGLRLGVFGESPKLRAFLKQQRIPFVDAGRELPAAPDAKAIYLGEASAEKLAGRVAQGMRVVFMDRGPETLPGVYVSMNGDGFTAKVTLPILDDLTTNPQSQETFAQIFYQVLPDTQRP